MRGWLSALFSIPVQMLVPRVSFCYGGSQVVRLASKDLFDSAIVAHPGPTSTAEIKAMKVHCLSSSTHVHLHLLAFQVPTSWICAEGSSGDVLDSLPFLRSHILQRTDPLDWKEEPKPKPSSNASTNPVSSNMSFETTKVKDLSYSRHAMLS